MSHLSAFGFSSPHLSMPDGPRAEYIVVQQPLRRVLAFLNVSIDTVCNDPIAKNLVYGYFKLHKQVNRSIEITELEQQWNPMGVR